MPNYMTTINSIMKNVLLVFSRFELRTTELEEIGVPPDEYDPGLIFFHGLLKENKRVITPFMSQHDLDYTLSNMCEVSKWLVLLDEETNTNRRIEANLTANMAIEDAIAQQYSSPMMSQRGNDLGRPQPTTESQMMSPLVRYLMFIFTGITGPMAMVATAVTDRPRIDIGTEAMMVVGVATTDSTTRMDQRGSHMNQFTMHLGLPLRTLRFLYLCPLIRRSRMRSRPMVSWDGTGKVYN